MRAALGAPLTANNGESVSKFADSYTIAPIS
jgi:hypothetical protein